MALSIVKAASAGTVIATVIGLSLAGGGVASAAPAHSGSGGTISATYDCVANDTTLTFVVGVRAHARVGQTITLRVRGDLGPHNEGAELPADNLNATLALTVSGAQSGTVDATGITNKKAIPLGQEILVSGGRAQVTLTTPGTVSFSLGTFSGTAEGTSQTCTVVGSAPVAASVQVRG
jgi:hypothetical protein